MAKSSISTEETSTEAVGTNLDQATMAKIFSFTIFLLNPLKMLYLYLIQQLAEALVTCFKEISILKIGPVRCRR